jgi:hypothetical protein
MKTNKIEAGNLRLLQGPLAAAGSVSCGYHFRIFLPDGQGGAITSDEQARAALPAATNDQEKRFAVYAWPMAKDQGQRMFFLCQDGQLRSLPWDGQEPVWNTALGNGWAGAPTWPLDSDRNGRGRNAAPAPADDKALF